MEILAKERKLRKEKPHVLRREGKLPGIIYSKKTSLGEGEVLPVVVNLDEFKKVYAEAGESTLVTVKVGDHKAQALIYEVQVDPLWQEPIHASFYEVDMKEEITANIPVEIINEEDHPVVRANEGIIITVLSEIEIKCLPNNLPAKFEVDANALKAVGDVLTVKEAIKVDTSKIEILVDLDEIVVKLDYAVQLETAEEEPMDVGDVEVTSEKKEEEGAENEDDKQEKPED